MLHIEEFIPKPRRNSSRQGPYSSPIGPKEENEDDMVGYQQKVLNNICANSQHAQVYHIGIIGPYDYCGDQNNRQPLKCLKWRRNKLLQ